MTISKEIIALIKFAGVKHPSGHGLIDAGDEIQSQEFRQEIALYDD